jgi:DNA-binding transcriptional LysR family regulator
MPLRFTLRQLEYFVAVGAAGSIAAAAEAINVSSPSISAAIGLLETEFGIDLFVRRHAQGLSLTPGGRRFFTEAKLLLESADGLHDLAADIATAPRGPIAIGAFVTLAPLILASLRRSFEAAFPDARVAQREGDQEGLLTMLRRAEIDVAITYDLEIPPDVAFAPLAALPPHLLVAAGHRFAGLEAVALAALAAEPMVLLDLPFSRDYFLALFAAAGLRPRIAERSRDIAVVRSLVANGYGYALANLRFGGERAPDGTPLVAVALAGEQRPMVVGLATVRSERQRRIVTAFAEHCRGRIAGGDIAGLG